MSEIAMNVVRGCEAIEARPLHRFFGSDLLNMPPDGLDGMVGNVATLLMAQTVCYIKSQGEIAEAMRSNKRSYHELHMMVESCKTVGKKVRR